MSWKSLVKFISGLKGAYYDINPTTLTGAVDIIVIKQKDDSFSCGPFYVRFGKLTAFSPADKIVEVYVNNEFVEFLRMRLSNSGDAYFVDSTEEHFDKIDSPEPVQLPCDDSWSNLTPHKRRRKFRRDSAMSEPDVLSNRDDDNINNGCEVLSDCEDGSGLLVSNTMKSINCPFVSDSQLSETSQVIQDLEWDWGLSSSGNLPLIQCHGSNIDSKMLNDGNLEYKEITNNEKIHEDVYLEDLITSKFDNNIKETYIYPSRTNSEKSSKFVPNQLNVDGNCFDYGYRSDNEHSPRSLSPFHPHLDSLRLSLCGGFTDKESICEEKFLQYIVSYEDFVYDPRSILANPNLVVYFNGRYCNWKVVAPSIVSLLAFQTELPYLTLRRLEDLYVPKKQSRRISWFSWGTSQPQPPMNTKPIVPMTDVPIVMDTNKLSNSNTADKFPETSEENVNAHKNNRLTSYEVSKLNLKPGRNDIEFRLITKYQGTCSCSASIYYWNWYDRIVVSDVDGTITRSDVLGHLLPMLGRDWTHDGVARLYNTIENNGYRFIYLSARAIGQAGITRSYLRQVVQNPDLKLPDGPILVSPNSLLYAFHQEVIVKKPEIFKIQCLRDVCALFLNEKCPLFAGFGNKMNDVLAYQEAGIKLHRIFTIKPSGDVRNEYNQLKSTTYMELGDMVDHYFPYLQGSNFNALRIQCDDDKDDNVLNNKIESKLHKDSMNIDLSSFSYFTFWQNSDYELSFSLPEEISANGENKC